MECILLSPDFRMKAVEKYLRTWNRVLPTRATADSISRLSWTTTVHLESMMWMPCLSIIRMNWWLNYSVATWLLHFPNVNKVLLLVFRMLTTGNIWRKWIWVTMVPRILPKDTVGDSSLLLQWDITSVRKRSLNLWRMFSLTWRFVLRGGLLVMTILVGHVLCICRQSTWQVPDILPGWTVI